MGNRKCRKCSVIRPLDEYRITNHNTGYHSKTCPACEKIVIVQEAFAVTQGGHVYLLADVMHPQFIKFGYTSNIRSRLSSYNKLRPVATCVMTYVSKCFLSPLMVEQVILGEVSKKYYSTPERQEWFPIEAKQLFIDLIDKANNEATLMEQRHNIY